MAYLRGLAPKWGGSFGQIDAFVREPKQLPMTPEAKSRLEAQEEWIKGNHGEIYKDFEAAFKHYKKSYDLYPKNPWRQKEAARIAYFNGSKEVAFYLFSELIIYDPKNIFALQSRGHIYEALLNFKWLVLRADSGWRSRACPRSGR